MLGPGYSMNIEAWPSNRTHTVSRRSGNIWKCLTSWPCYKFGRIYFTLALAAESANMGVATAEKNTRMNLL